MYEKLFEPIYIGTMELKNRLVVPAMSTLFANQDGSCTEKFIAYHEAKAKGGWGLIITEYYGVLKYVKELDFKIDLRLYHEVAVVPASAQYFEYINCHPGTGLLGKTI